MNDRKQDICKYFLNIYNIKSLDSWFSTHGNYLSIADLLPPKITS